jgi:hypothetical protein
MEQDNTSESGAGEREVAPARQRWQALIAQQKESGLGVAAFCRERSIPPTTIYGWRTKLAGTGAKAMAGPASGRFVAVRLSQGCAGAGSVAGQVPLEICLAGGRRVLVRRGFDRQLLIETVRALEQLA